MWLHEVFFPMSHNMMQEDYKGGGSKGVLHTTKVQ